MICTEPNVSVLRRVRDKTAEYLRSIEGEVGYDVNALTKFLKWMRKLGTPRDQTFVICDAYPMPENIEMQKKLMARAMLSCKMKVRMNDVVKDWWGAAYFPSCSWRSYRLGSLRKLENGVVDEYNFYWWTDEAISLLASKYRASGLHISETDDRKVVWEGQKEISNLIHSDYMRVGEMPTEVGIYERLVEKAMNGIRLTSGDISWLRENDGEILMESLGIEDPDCKFSISYINEFTDMFFSFTDVAGFPAQNEFIRSGLSNEAYEAMMDGNFVDNMMRDLRTESLTSRDIRGEFLYTESIDREFLVSGILTKKNMQWFSAERLRKILHWHESKLPLGVTPDVWVSSLGLPSDAICRIIFQRQQDLLMNMSDAVVNQSIRDFLAGTTIGSKK